MAEYTPEKLRRKGEYRCPPWKPVSCLPRTASDIARDPNRCYMIRRELCAKPGLPPPDYMDKWTVYKNCPEASQANQDQYIVCSPMQSAPVMPICCPISPAPPADAGVCCQEFQCKYKPSTKRCP